MKRLNTDDNTSRPPPSGHAISSVIHTAFDDPNRFYAGVYPPFQYEPTRDKFQIIRTDDKGEGIISLVEFNVGDTVFIFTGEIIPYQKLTTLQIEVGKYVSDPYFMGKVLHSCDPNMDCDMRTLTFTARRHIKPDDYLTMDYEQTEDELFRQFTCCCGASNCRHFIRGRKFKSLLHCAEIIPL